MVVAVAAVDVLGGGGRARWNAAMMKSDSSGWEQGLRSLTRAGGRMW